MDEKRSALRKHGAAYRRLVACGAMHDAHVRAWHSAYTKSQRALWTCPRCQRLVRQGDRIRNQDGQRAKHCGCGTGERGHRRSRYGTSTAGAAGKRLARIMGLPGFKQMKCDAHVRCRAEFLKGLKAQQSQSRQPICAKKKRDRRIASQNRATAELTDAYVRKRLRRGMPMLKGVKLPPTLIDLERLRLMICREVQKKGMT